MLILFGASIYALVRYNTYAEVKNRLEEQADRIKNSQNYSIGQGLDLYLDPMSANRLEDAQLFVQIHNYVNSNTRYSQNLKDWGMKFPIPSADSIHSMKGFQNIRIYNNPFLLYQVPVILDGQLIGLIQLAAYTGAEDRLMERMKTVMLFGSFISIIVASTLGLFLARKSMAPIGKVIEAANGIQTGNDLSVRIDYSGPNDEIGQLIGTVNRMLERTEGFYKELDEAYLAQRRFVSDASHELRTPLTTIRGNVDLLKKMWNQGQEASFKTQALQLRHESLEALSDIADESERMSRLINDMLSLARADAGQTIAKEELELAPIVEEVIRRAQFLPRKAAWIQGDLSVLQNAYVVGNRDYLQQMLFIFIENAFKYTPEGSVILDAIQVENQIGIRVVDTGIGMDRDEIPHIFERFYRADPSRGVIQGTGLGLAIAKWIIDEHGGSVEVLTRREEGTTFLIWLPVHFNDQQE